MSPAAVPIERLEVAAFRVPTDRPESDGTFSWSSTTLVTVHASAGSARGFGYTYGSATMVPLIHEELGPHLLGHNAFAIEAASNVLAAQARNLGRPGIVSTAISAIDTALWDLKSKLLGVSLVTLLGDVRAAALLYGSGGFTSYSIHELCDQLVAWAEAGFTQVKMKVGRDPNEDVRRVSAATKALGTKAKLMVDANGAYRASQALEKAEAFADQGVVWLEEPTSSDDLAGLHFVREHAPAGMDVAAGEYGYDSIYFRRMLEAGAVDVLQADATRCLGISGFLAASRLCQAYQVPLSAHTAPSLHAHLACAATPLMHVEYFHDHVRIEQLLFDGFLGARHGVITADRSRIGLGIELKTTDAKKYLLSERVCTAQT